MANAFDSTNYPEKEPEEIYAGDRVAWKRTDLGVDYPVASYELSYSARLEGTNSRLISISASESGNDYLVEVSQATTKSWVPGRYQWVAYITRTSDSERVAVEYGVWEVKANRSTSSADPRSHARKVLENIEAAIEALSSKTAKSYTIMGREMTYSDLPELLTLRKEYQAEVRSEDRKANGTGGGKVVVKFNR
jgi:hypothetical protein